MSSTVRIELTHFRCWEKKTFLLPCEGMCLIHGRSGRGKSTLLNAVYYAITGKLKNITSFGKRSTTVRIEWPDLVITRSRLPTKLVVCHHQQTHEEDAAQAILDQLFGAQFGATSYIDQDNSFSFVNLSPAEKMEFLERAILELQGRSIEKMRAHIRDQMSMVKLRHAEWEGKCSTMEKLLANMTKPEVPVVKIESNVVQAHTVDKLTEKLTANLAVVERNLKIAQNRLRRLEEQQEEKNRERSRLLLTQQQLEEVERELLELSEYSDADRFHELQERRDRLVRMKDALRARDHWEMTLRRLEKQKQEQTDRVQHAEQERLKYPPVDPKRLQTLQEAAQRWKELVELDAALDGFDRDQAKEEIESIQRDIDRDRMLKVSCPECEASLSYHPDKHLLVRREARPSSEQGDVKKEMQRLAEKEKRFHRLSALCDRYNEQFSVLETMLVPLEIELDEDAILTELDALTTRSTRLKEIEREMEAARDPRHLREAEREEAEARKRWESFEPLDHLDAIDDREEDLHDLIRTCSVFGEKHQRVFRLQQRKQTLMIERSSSSSSVEEQDTITQERDKFTGMMEKRDKYHSYLEDIKQWKTCWEKRKAFDELEMEVVTSREQRQECMDQMRAWVKLREHLRSAEQQCMREFVQSLNAHASIYLEEFFDEGLLVELRCIEANEKDAKPSRATMQFEVHHQGTVTDLSSLSGGEKDRVNLAFTLALSELLHPSLLMLDECISSLDAETTSAVLETLKKTYKGKLVLLVSHQANLGWFDEVVEV